MMTFQSEKDVPITYLSECFILHEDGTLTWRTRPRKHFPDERVSRSWNARIAGHKAGYLMEGYINVTINNRTIKAHRLIWALITGAWPSNEIDHIDGNGSNNQPSNLREATDNEQGQNKKRYKHNASGFTGVSWDRQQKKWVAQIQVDSKNRRLGFFETKEEAYAAYLTAKRTLHLFQPTPRA